MLYFFSDLDNTLVYSHRIPLPGNSIAVEYLNNRIQSNMTKKTYTFLNKSSELFIIPTTTRTCEQYARLSDTFTKFRCKYALVCNGGILLDNNAIDSDWLDETKKMAGDELISLHYAYKSFRLIFSEEQIKTVEDVMIYAKSDNPVKDANKLLKHLNANNLNVFYDSRKVYCFPISINKGNAMTRFSRRMGIARTIAAGDSIPDVSMLNAADMAIMPVELSNLVRTKHKYILEDSRIFSDFICDVLSGYCNY